MLFVFAIGIGIVAGLRAFVGLAIVAWAIHLGWMNLGDSRLAVVGSTGALAILSLLALAELIIDKLPQTPNRTAPGPLFARTVTGGLCAACLVIAGGQSSALGACLGAVGALVGAFAGYEIRNRLVTRLRINDFVVAVCEDAVVIGAALFFASR